MDGHGPQARVAQDGAAFCSRKLEALASSPRVAIGDRKERLARAIQQHVSEAYGGNADARDLVRARARGSQRGSACVS